MGITPNEIMPKGWALFHVRPRSRLCFYRLGASHHMSYGPTGRCHFCRSMYYLEKLRDHEAACSSRPRRLTVGEAVRIAVETNQAASTNTALLVRLVWQIKDGYWSEPPRGRLTDPDSITRELRPQRTAPDRRRGARSILMTAAAQPPHPPSRRGTNSR